MLAAGLVPCVAMVPGPAASWNEPYGRRTELLAKQKAQGVTYI